jgi:hypothetical protein
MTDSMEVDPPTAGTKRKADQELESPRPPRRIKVFPFS